MTRDQIDIIPSGGCVDCGGRCVIKLHVKDGVVIRVSTDDGQEPQLRACVRGRAYRKRVYDPNRLKYPLKRTGARGEGKFERISWEEALDTMADKIKEVKAAHGPEAVFSLAGTGNPGLFHGPWQFMHLMKLFGATTGWGGPSAENSVFASRSVYGTLSTGNTRDDLKNSRLIIMWGWNPATSIYGTNTSYYLAKAREAGARIICVDPRFTNSAAILSHQKCRKCDLCLERWVNGEKPVCVEACPMRALDTAPLDELLLKVRHAEEARRAEGFEYSAAAMHSIVFNPLDVRDAFKKYEKT